MAWSENLQNQKEKKKKKKKRKEKRKKEAHVTCPVTVFLEKGSIDIALGCY